MDGETTTPAPGPVPPVDVHRGCWWGHGLATTADSDDDEAVRGGAGPTPFSAARGASGGLAGDALARCKLCDGEFARDDVALLNGCNHPFCVPCVETWAARRARSCPTCKKDFDGWHYGEKIPGGNERRGRAMGTTLLPTAAADGREETGEVGEGAGVRPAAHVQRPGGG